MKSTSNRAGCTVAQLKAVFADCTEADLRRVMGFLSALERRSEA